MTTKLAKYDPRVEGAALALLDKMHTALAEAKTIQGAKELHTLATVAKDRARSLPAYNRAAALIFAAEVAIGQMLLKEKAPSKGWTPTKKNASASTAEALPPTLQELLGARDTNTANHMAAAFRKLADTITVEQLKSAERLATQYNERLTRKSASLIVSGSWNGGKKKDAPAKAALTISRAWGMLSEANEAELAALQWLKDHGAQVDPLLQHARAIAGAIRKERQK